MDIALHVEQYLAAIELQKLDSETLRIAEWSLNKLVAMGGWKKIGDITADSMRTILSELDKQRKAASYLNKFIMRAKAFCNWLRDQGRLSGDPLSREKLKRVDEQNGRKSRARRAMSHAEVKAQFEAAPDDRKLKYAFAVLAGLRRGELADLQWSDLKLNTPRPFISLRADQTKNKNADALPLHPYLIELLRKLTPGADNEPVVATVPDMKTMARDLLAAGIAKIADAGHGVRIGDGQYINIPNKKGERVDFHSLRHVYQTNLEATGASYTTCKALLRHSTASDVTPGYSHARLGELYAAIERLPHPLHPPVENASSGEGVGNVALWTGTEDLPTSTPATSPLSITANTHANGLSDSCYSADHIQTKTFARPCAATPGKAGQVDHLGHAGDPVNAGVCSDSCTSMPGLSHLGQECFK